MSIFKLAQLPWRARIIAVGLGADQRHHPVADEFIDNAAGARDRLAGRFEVAVQQENQIIRQLLFGNPSKRA